MGLRDVRVLTMAVVERPDNPHPEESADFDALTSLHVHRAADGSPESLEWLVRRFSPLLLAQAGHRLGTGLRRWYEPDDIVQDAWAVALPKLASVNQRDGRLTPVVLKFLSTTVLYRIQTLLQKHLRIDDGEMVPKEIGASFSNLPDEATQIVTQVVRGEREDAIRKAIEELPEPDREVVILRGIEQNSVAEIALLLDEKPNTISVRYRRALERLRALLPDSVFAELMP